MGWLFAGLFLGPFGLLVAFLPKIDRTAFIESQIDNVEFHLKSGVESHIVLSEMGLFFPE